MCKDGPVPWLSANTDEVETLQSHLVTWLVLRMEPSSLGGLPLNMGQSKGIPMLCREYLDTYLEENLGLDPNAVVKVQGEL